METLRFSKAHGIRAKDTQCASMYPGLTPAPTATVTHLWISSKVNSVVRQQAGPEDLRILMTSPGKWIFSVTISLGKCGKVIMVPRKLLICFLFL